VTTARGAIIQVDMNTGEYNYFATAENNSGQDFKEVIKAVYQDSDGDTATASISFLVNQTDGLHNDETIIYNSTLSDGATGIDTLIFSSQTVIDFTALTSVNNPIKNMEIIDLGSNGNHTLTNLSLQDVIDMTDSTTHDLYILGDSGDTVDFLNGDNWSKNAVAVTETVNGSSHTFDVYTNSVAATSGDPTVTVKVEQAITDTI